MKISAIVTFFNQEKYKDEVLSRIRPQVDELIVIENQGSLVEQRRIGYEKSSGDIILFCDGDMLVSREFLHDALYVLQGGLNIAVVGGMLQTRMRTPSECLMGILRYRKFSFGYRPAGVLMVKREAIEKGAWFGKEPVESNVFYKKLEELGYIYASTSAQLIHLGEPKTEKELLARQRKYSVNERASFIKKIAFYKTPLFLVAFAIPYLWYVKDNPKPKHSFLKLALLFRRFMKEYYEAGE